MPRAKPAPARHAAHAPDPQTWDHVVRAAAHCGQLEAAAVLMRLCREHAHDPELLARTAGVRGADGVTLLMRAVERCDVARAAEIVGACPTPASRAQLLAYVDSDGWTALHFACNSTCEDEDSALALAEVLLAAGADLLARCGAPSGLKFQPIHLAAMWSARLVQRLVAAGASIDGDVAGNSTLCCAASASTALGVRMIPALVALGARETLGGEAMQRFANWPVEGDPPSDEEVRAALTSLVSVGCSLTAPQAPHEYLGWSPMGTAIHWGNAPVVTALLALGVTATTQSLARAVVFPDIVRVLLAAGVPPGGLVKLLNEADTVTPLMAAAEASAVDSVRLLLAAGASVHDSNEQGSTALMYAFLDACSDDVPRVVEALLAAGASVTARNLDGHTPLHSLARYCAAQPWAAAVARKLLASGADASATNNAGETPIECVPDRRSARDGELYALLLAAANEKRGVTVLMRAVERCDVARAAEIVGACPTPASRAQLLACVDAHGATALHRACSRHREDEDAAMALAEVLLGAGADPLATIEETEKTFASQPIHFAAMWSARLVQRLVAAGASIDGNVAGNSTLLSAARAGTALGVRMIPALVALGARETLGNEAVFDFAHWPVEGAPPSDEEVRAALAALVSVGCSLTEPDAEDGETPMDIAANRGNAPVVTALLALGVAATTTSLVKGSKYPGIVRVLLAAGAPPGGLVQYSDGPTLTPLMAAAQAAALESVRLLLGAGASVHDSNDFGDTALHRLVWSETPEAAAIARLLLAHGASARATNYEGETPAECGRPNGGEVYALLKAAEAQG
jgi:ankyrin repeat protein